MPGFEEVWVAVTIGVGGITNNIPYCQFYHYTFITCKTPVLIIKARIVGCFEFGKLSDSFGLWKFKLFIVSKTCSTKHAVNHESQTLFCYELNPTGFVQQKKP